jgi:large subunit ribosomal protein L6
MSRVGKKPIKILEGVEIKIDGQKITVKGPKGELSREIRPEIMIQEKQGEIILAPKTEAKKAGAFWGLTRSLIANMVQGVAEGYEKKLDVQGLGYKANLEGEDLVLKVGFSHIVNFLAVDGVKLSVDKNIITVSGIDKEKVGQTAAEIRKIKPPEPYKGKGIRYEGEEVRIKVGKKAATAE